MEMSDSEKSLNASRRPFSQIDEDEDVECDNPEIRFNDEIPSEVSTLNIIIYIMIENENDSEKSLNVSQRPFIQINEDEDVECDNPEIRYNNEIPSEVVSGT